MASRLILLVLLAAAIALAGGAITIAGGIGVIIKEREGPGFGTGMIFAGGLLFVGAFLGLVPGLVLLRAAAVLRAASPGLPASSSRGQAVSRVATTIIAVGLLAGLVLVAASRLANAVVLAAYLGIGLVSVTSAWTARYVPDGGLGRALLYVAVIGAILAGLLTWVYAR